MSAHIFSPEVACAVGVNAAVIFQNIAFWCERNEANNENMHEGRAWTFNSVKAFETLFPYLTSAQVRYALDRLVEDGYLGVGNFHEDTRIRTKWYCVLKQVHLSPVANGSVASSKCNKETDVNTDINTDSKREATPSLFGDIQEKKAEKKPDRFSDFWNAYPKKAGKEAALKAWEKATKKTDPEKIIAAARVYAGSDGVLRGFVKYPQGWLNDGRFNDPDLQPAPTGASKPYRYVHGGIER